MTEKGGREVIEADEVAGGVVPRVGYEEMVGTGIADVEAVNAQLLGLFDEVGGMVGSLEVDPEFTRGVRFVLNLEA